MSAKRAAAYVRVSTEEQTEGWSIDGQETQIAEYAERNGYQIIQTYHDETSGSQDKRPGLERMLLDAHAGLFEAIIVINTSRFFRNLELARRYKTMLRDKLNIEVISVSQPIAMENPMGYMVETINEIFDEYYLVQLKFWTKLGKKTRAQRGLWNGTLPFGYTSDEDKMPIPHPKNAEGIRLAFEAYATGLYSDRDIADLLNREGYQTTGNWGNRPFTIDTVNRMLRNVFYLGYTKYKGEIIPGIHQPIISQELFDQAQEARARRTAHRRAIGETKRTYIFSGLARCHLCKLTLRCGGGKNEYRYYRHKAKERGYNCSLPSKSIRAEKLEDQWSAIASNIKLPPNWRSHIEALILDADQQEAILRERKQVEEKLKRIKELYMEDMLDVQTFKERLEKLQAQLATLILPNTPHIMHAGEYLEQLGTLWQASTIEEKREMTRLMVKAVYVDLAAEKIRSIEPLPIYRFLFKEVCEEIGIEIL